VLMGQAQRWHGGLNIDVASSLSTWQTQH